VIPVCSLLLVCFLPIPSAHEAAGAAGIRHSPRPLGAKDSCTTRAHRAARSGSHVWNWSRHRHSGAMPTGPREARPDDRLRIEPGISRFRVWSCGPSRNDGYGFTGCLKIESETIPWARTRATPSLVVAREGGRSSIPETPMMEARSRGVLDTPLSRSMTGLCGAAPCAFAYDFDGMLRRGACYRAHSREPLASGKND
jgi:hypothetical protein